MEALIQRSGFKLLQSPLVAKKMVVKRTEDHDRLIRKMGMSAPQLVNHIESRHGRMRYMWSGKYRDDSGMEQDIPEGHILQEIEMLVFVAEKITRPELRQGVVKQSNHNEDLPQMSFDLTAEEESRKRRKGFFNGDAGDDIRSTYSRNRRTRQSG